MPIVLLLFILVSGGVSFAAEGTLPGDVLYPVKVHVNENVRAAVTVSDEGDGEWDIRRMERRLQEAEALTVEGEFNAEAQAQLEERFDAFATQVEEHIAKLRAEGHEDVAARLSSNLEAALQAHERILAELSANDGEHISDFVVRIGLARQEAASNRSEIETEVSAGSQTDVRAASEGRLRAAEKKIAEVKAYLAKWEERFGVSATAHARTRLEVADRMVVDGKAKLDAGAYGEAFVLFQQAHRIAQEAKLLLEARNKLNVDVSIDADTQETGEEDVPVGDVLEGDEGADKEHDTPEVFPDRGPNGIAPGIHGNSQTDVFEGLPFRMRP